ncbi:MAG: hypothetical protein HQ558_02310 [Candidatus Omnitrophica bacterium]|nr:hypothetical protein [Candidatus Omnitrophota bacterium]
MKKVLIIIIALVLVASIAYAKNQYDLRKELWNDFNKVYYDKFGKLPDVVLYAENTSLTKICFINDRGLFIFRHNDPNDSGRSSIERVVHAKFIFYSQITRITYEKDGAHFRFKLWSNDKVELIVGA